MPIVTAHCQVVDGLGKPETRPQVFLKVNGMFFLTGIHLKKVERCEGGWTGSSIHYRADIDEKDLQSLRKEAERMLKHPPHKSYARDARGLKHCGIRFVF